MSNWPTATTKCPANFRDLRPFMAPTKSCRWATCYVLLICFLGKHLPTVTVHSCMSSAFQYGILVCLGLIKTWGSKDGEEQREIIKTMLHEHLTYIVVFHVIEHCLRFYYMARNSFDSPAHRSWALSTCSWNIFFKLIRLKNMPYTSTRSSTLVTNGH